MEMFLEVFFMVLFAFAAYKIAEKTGKDNPGLRVEPALYALGSAVFGFIWVMAFLICKVYLHHKK